MSKIGWYLIALLICLEVAAIAWLCTIVLGLICSDGWC